MRSIFIFLPNTLNMDSIGFLEGFVKKTDEHLLFYITNDQTLKEAGNTIGYCSSQTPFPTYNTNEDSEWLHINTITHEFKINNLNTEEYEHQFTLMVYDLNALSKCDITTFKLQKYGQHFNDLCTTLNKSSHKAVKPRFMLLYIVMMFLIEVILELFRNARLICQYSSTLSHLECSIKALKWGINSIQNSDKISIKVFNMISSKLIDLLMGFLAMYLFFKYEMQILEYLDITIERIIHGLKDLLVFLMGSPIGLKLNYSFNKTLGMFFFYHIFLWKTFMLFIKPYLYSLSYILLFPASFGLSFQAAVVEDLIKICTIHVYCIYIYAARLYGLQLMSLRALWRLFIGRKYNPLRNRIDSHQYSHNQLFIGTLGFTILLFLLPTTLLYYLVFTVFRLFLKFSNYSLLYLRVLIQYLPIYTLLLWIINSPIIAATVVISVQSKVDEVPTVLFATLKSLPLASCVRSTAPHSNFELPPTKWYNEINSIVVGKLL